MNRTIVKILLILIVTILIVFSISTTIASLKNKSEMDSLEKQINGLESDIKELKSEISSLSEKDALTPS